MRSPDRPAPKEPVYGVCFDCGAVAWELLRGVSDLCMGCDPSAYRDDWEDDPCAHCDCLTDDECVA